MSEFKTAIGLMSGTSMDGIDAALIKTDGETVELTDYFVSIPYKDSFKGRIKQAVENHTADHSELEHDITVSHATAVEILLGQAKLQPGDVDVIGFHGQTLFHAPDLGVTRQIGDGNLLASITGIDVVNDFRTNDVSLGGQGAPLVPLFHKAILQKQNKPFAVINIGGVANITYISDDQIFAFDTGPGNALIDDWINKTTGEDYDRNGQLASTGIVDESILKGLLSHEYFEVKPPKSLDRNTFRSEFINTLSPEDGAATLTAFTCRSIAMSEEYLNESPKSWFIFGGGRKNRFMMKELDKLVEGEVVVAEDVDFNGDAIEAQAFGYLAVRSIMKLPITLPGTTGVKSAATGGAFCQA